MGRGGGRIGGGGRGFSGRSSFSSRGFSSFRNRSSMGRSSVGGSVFGRGSSPLGGTVRGYRNRGPVSSGPQMGGSSLWPLLLFPRRKNTVVINNYGDRGQYDRGSYNKDYGRMPASDGSTGPAGGMTTAPGGSNDDQPKTQKKGGGLLQALIIIFGIFCLFMAFNSFLRLPRTGHDRLSYDALQLSDSWYEDELGWINDEDELIAGLRYFYQETGVQPYVLICDELGGYSWDIDDAYAEEWMAMLYDQFFADEGHLIYVFMEYAPSEFISYIYAGSAADTVIDDEGRSIIFDNTAEYYYDDSLSDEGFFSKVFEESADDIMGTGSRNAFYVWTALTVMSALGGGLYYLYQRRRQREQEEAERLKRILEAPLEDSPEEKELREKYILKDEAPGGADSEEVPENIDKEEQNGGYT